MKKTLNILLIMIITIFTVSANATTILEKVDESIITAGARKYHYKILATEGWQNINVIRVDLQNENVKLDLLNAKEGVQYLANVKNMVSNSNAIAGINSDFFNPETSTTGSALGFSMSNGQVVTSTYYGNAITPTMATFSLTQENQALFSYITNKINLITPSGEIISCADINRKSATYESPNIFTNKWGKMSVGASGYSDMVEIVAKDGIVTEVRYNSIPVEIPENGFVVTAHGWGGEALLNNFKIGDAISYNVETTPNLYNPTMAVGGDTLLLGNGEILTFTHEIAGINPRTAIGASEDNRYIYLVTVDGRVDKAVGMSLWDLALFMKKIGCYNAINCDGGGSTTMVSKNLITNELEVDTITSSYLRPVANGLGVFKTSTKGELAILEIKPEIEDVFVNTKVKLNIYGYDKNYNLVSVDENQVTWSLESGNGVFENGYFTPTNQGKAIIKACIKDITTKYEINILTEPLYFNIYSNDVVLANGESTTYTLKGKDKNGYWSNINLKDLDVTFSNDIGYLTGNVFTATKEGQSIMKVKIGEAISYARIVVVNSKETKVTNKIELPSNVTLKDPAREDNKEVESTENSFQFVVMGDIKESKTLLEKIYENKIKNAIKDKKYELLVSISDNTNSSILSTDKQIINAKGYSITEYKNSTFISINNKTNGSIMDTDVNQWTNFIKDLENVKSENIFILLPVALHDGNDTDEINWFQEYIDKYGQKTGKNIWVISKRTSEIRGTIDERTEFLYTRDINSNVNTDIVGELERAKYLVVTVDGTKITYEFKKIFD